MHKVNILYLVVQTIEKSQSVKNYNLSGNNNYNYHGIQGRIAVADYGVVLKEKLPEGYGVHRHWLPSIKVSA